MFFKTPLAYAVFAAASASLPFFLLGVLVFAAWWAVVTFHIASAAPALKHVLTAICICLFVFVSTFCASFFYARKAWGRSWDEVPKWILLPVAFGVHIVTRFQDWRTGTRQAN